MQAIKPTTWSARRAGNLNQFYTRSDVSDLLIREIGSEQVHRSIDLGAGEGSLSSAVAQRWPAAEITTVDVDAGCRDQLHARLVSAGVARHVHMIDDVFRTDLPIDLGLEQFDLAVCNPPFFRPEWRREFADILQAAEFERACKSVSEVTAEILFFAQNLRLVRDGGTIALIVPDGLATGWRSVAFRRALMEKHTLRCAIQLPPYSFHDTEAYCFILIVTKGAHQGNTPVKLLRLFDDGRASEPVLTTPEQASVRLDWAYHTHVQELKGGHTSLRELGADIRRGSLSTVERRTAAFPVFHTGDFPVVGERVCLPEVQVNYPSAKLVVAKPGDILIARVDRDLHNKITLVERGAAPLTDCVYRVSIPGDKGSEVFAALASECGRTAIQAVTKGVGARLLGKGDLLDLPLNLIH